MSKVTDNTLLFFSKNDIPFEKAKLLIHNPTINELSLIGEEDFRIGTHVITESGKLLKSQGNSDLKDKDDFDIFIAILNNKEEHSSRDYVLSLFSILFPNYKFRVRETDIQLLENKENGLSGFIDRTNFTDFQEIITKMFLLESETGEGSYNPADGMAAKIAEKFKKAKQRKQKAEDNGTNSKISVYKRYASILSIGLGLDVNLLLNYTVSQLEISFKRFVLLTQWDINIKARLAGASDIDEAEDWMKEL